MLKSCLFFIVKVKFIPLPYDWHDNFSWSFLVQCKLYVYILMNDHQFWSQNLDKKCPGCGVRVRRRDLKRLLFPGPGCEDPGWRKRNLITFIHQYVKAACSLHNIQYMYWPGINKEAGFRIQWFYLLSVKFLRGSIFFFITRMESSCLIYTEGTR